MGKIVELNHQSHKQKLHCAKKRNIADAVKFASKFLLLTTQCLYADLPTANINNIIFLSFLWFMLIALVKIRF